MNKVDKEYNYIDLDAQAVRLAKPIKFLHIFTVKAELLAKNESGEWESIGYGTIPPGAYIKGRAPEAYRTNIMLEEEAK